MFGGGECEYCLRVSDLTQLMDGQRAPNLGQRSQVVE